MFRKTLAVVATLSAVAAAVVVAKKTAEKKVSKDEEQVHFISIEDGDEEEEEDPSPEVKEIAGIYPYLTKKFIAEQFARNDAFNREYPEDTLITIAHKSAFTNTDMRNEFAKIASENGYEVETLNDAEVVIYKKMFATDGAILSDIYNVANQVNCLNGTYEGYKID